MVCKCDCGHDGMRLQPLAAAVGYRSVGPPLEASPQHLRLLHVRIVSVLPRKLPREQVWAPCFTWGCNRLLPHSDSVKKEMLLSREWAGPPFPATWRNVGCSARACSFAVLGVCRYSKNPGQASLVTTRHTVFVVFYGFATLFLPTIYFYDVFTYVQGQGPTLPAFVSQSVHPFTWPSPPRIAPPQMNLMRLCANFAGRLDVGAGGDICHEIHAPGAAELPVERLALLAMLTQWPRLVDSSGPLTQSAGRQPGLVLPAHQTTAWPSHSACFNKNRPIKITHEVVAFCDDPDCDPALKEVLLL